MGTTGLSVWRTDGHLPGSTLRPLKFAAVACQRLWAPHGRTGEAVQKAASLNTEEVAWVWPALLYISVLQVTHASLFLKGKSAVGHPVRVMDHSGPSRAGEAGSQRSLSPENFHEVSHLLSQASPTCPH